MLVRVSDPKRPVRRSLTCIKTDKLKQVRDLRTARFGSETLTSDAHTSDAPIF